MATTSQWGTIVMLDTQDWGVTPVIEYGIDRAFSEFQPYLDAHNVITNQMVSDVVEGTTDKQRFRYGGVATFKMGKIDKEFGVADAARVSTGYTVGLPIDTYAPQSLQWTDRAFQRITVEELNAQFSAQLMADVDNTYREVQRALFTPTNITGYVDEDTDGTSFDIVRLVNADSRDIPVGPYGEIFDASSHTHYFGTETLTVANLKTLQSAVMEHYSGGNVRIYINSAQETTVRGFTGFLPALDSRVIRSVNADHLGPGFELDIWNAYDRRIGILEGGAEIWVKPWIPAGIVFAFIVGQTKPLIRRKDKYDPVDLTVVTWEQPSNRHGKMTAYSVERTFGYGTQNRLNGAIMSVNGVGNGTNYIMPTIA